MLPPCCCCCCLAFSRVCVCVCVCVCFQRRMWTLRRASPKCILFYYVCVRCVSLFVRIYTRWKQHIYLSACIQHTWTYMHICVVLQAVCVRASIYVYAPSPCMYSCWIRDIAICIEVEKEEEEHNCESVWNKQTLRAICKLYKLIKFKNTKKQCIERASERNRKLEEEAPNTLNKKNTCKTTTRWWVRPMIQRQCICASTAACCTTTRASTSRCSANRPR